MIDDMDASSVVRPRRKGFVGCGELGGCAESRVEIGRLINQESGRYLDASPDLWRHLRVRIKAESV
jgi:hypothetical protein